MAARRWADDADVLLLAAEAARNSGVWQVTDGKVSPPEAA